MVLLLATVPVVVVFPASSPLPLGTRPGLSAPRWLVVLSSTIVLFAAYLDWRFVGLHHTGGCRSSAPIR
jgi:hypothetical protein